MKRLIAVFCAALLLVPAAGCGKNKETRQQPNVAIRQVVETADPETALEKIYEQVEIRGLSDADAAVLQEKFFIDTTKLDDYYVRYSKGDFGLADVFILKPTEDEAPAVREMLEKVKLNRAAEFENYDIYNAHQIALDAPIIDQGGYLILLMLEDTQRAREIVDQYFPKD